MGEEHIMNNSERLYSYLCMLSKNWPGQPFYRTHNQIEKDTGIKQRTQFNIIKKLVEMELLEMSRGDYNRRMFRITPIATSLPTNCHTFAHYLPNRYIYINIYRKCFPSGNLPQAAMNVAHPKVDNIRSIVKKKKRDWVPYILEHWNSKGYPLSKHKTGTHLHRKIIEQVNQTLRTCSRRDICRRIDTYHWLLTETDLEKSLQYRPKGLVVDLAEFFFFTADTRNSKGFRFHFRSWFDEAGTTGLAVKYNKGNPKIAARLAKTILEHTGFKITIPKAMRTSHVLGIILRKYKLRKGIRPVEFFVYTMMSIGIDNPKYIGRQVFEEFETQLKQSDLIEKKKVHFFRLLERSWNKEEIPEALSSLERRGIFE